MKPFICIVFIILSFSILNSKDKYLVVTTEKYIQSKSLEKLIDYRSNEFEVMVALNNSIGTIPEQFISFIKQQNPEYILLVGNYQDFPSKTIPYSKPVESFNYWVAEQIDSLYQIRIPLGLFFVNNEMELDNIVSKTIKFEQYLEEMPQKLYTHSGDTPKDPLEPWPSGFCDEILDEMYNSFFRSNNYLHRHETSLDDTPNDAIRDAEAINNGVKYILYHGHGTIPKWSYGMGVQGIPFLKNTEYFPIIFSSSCLTGTFTGKIDTIKSPCFATNMLASQNGAAAFIGAFNESSKGQNPLLYGFSKAVNDYANVRIGDALIFAFNNMELPETVNKYYPHVTKFEFNRARLQFHLFGDPALKINNNSTNVNDNIDLDQNYLSPNPASDYIEINPPLVPPLTKGDAEGRGISSIKIYNALGECVMTVGANGHSTIHRIDVSHLPVGLYFIKIGDYLDKFVKH